MEGLRLPNQATATVGSSWPRSFLMNVVKIVIRLQLINGARDGGEEVSGWRVCEGKGMGSREDNPKLT